MLRYAAVRLAVTVPLLIGLSVLVFLYIHVIPGDPVAGMLGPAGTPALIAQLRHQFGLDQPIPVQYWHWVDGLLHGSLGISFVSRQPIASILVGRIPASLELMFAGMLAVVLIGWPLGFLAGLYKDSWLDHVVSSLAGVGLAVPQFWLGTIFVLILAVKLGWLPAEGYVPFTVSPAQNLHDLVMPALTLGLSLSPYLIRMTRAATVEVQQELFAKQALAKGLRRRTILVRYIARNAILAVVVVLGLQLGALIGSQFIIEDLFNWPGVGGLLIAGVRQRDYFMIQAVVLVVAVFYALVNLGAELVHAWLDPRLARDPRRDSDTAARTAWTSFVGALRALLRSRRALVGLCLVTVVVLMALISFVWTPYPPGAINEFAANLSPRWSHLAGTDELGRDVFSRIMAGARTSIAIAGLAVAGALAAGTFVGFLTGYVGGAIDVVVSRITDMLLAIPALAIALGVVAVLQPSTFSVSSQIVAVAIALAAAYTPTFTRVVRGSVVSVRNQPFVEASRGLASSTPSIMARDIFPNVLPIIAVQVTTTLAWAIIDEAALGFLGLGVQPPTPSWGSLLNEGRTYLYQVPWLPVAAGIAVVTAILGINLFGDGLRDLLDPHAKK